MKAVSRFLERHPTGRVGQPEVMLGAELSEDRAREALAGLQAAGRVVRLGFRGRVYELQGRAMSQPPVSLQSLTDLIRDCLTESSLPFRVPGPADDSERLHRQHLTPSQAKDARTALNHLSRYLGGATNEPLPPHVTEYEASTGSWLIVGQLDRRLADPTAEKRARGAAARAKVRSSLSFLLDVAANRGLITRTDEMPTAWCEWLPSTDERGRRHRVNCRRLATEALSLGYATPDSVDWNRLGTAISRKPVADRDRLRLQDARTAFRKLRPDISLEVRRLEAGQRLCPVSMAQLRQAVAGRWEDWTVASVGEAIRSLVGGNPGLQGWMAWLTSKSEFGVDGAGIPTRREVMIHEGACTLGRTSQIRVTQDTAHGHLRMACVLLATLERQKIPIASLDELADVGRVGKVVEELCDLGRNCASSLLSISRYLVAHAVQRGDLADARKMQGLLARVQHLVPSIKVVEVTRVRAVVGAIGGNPDQAWERLTQVRDLEIARIERLAGRCIHDQLADLRRGGGAWQTSSWALAVRDTVMFGLVMRIPLRRRTASLMRLSAAQLPAKTEAVAMWVSGDPRQPWTGELGLDCTAGAMKAKRGFHPKLIIAARVGDPHAEQALRRDLLELYLGPRGARQFLIRGLKDELAPFWVQGDGTGLKRVNGSVRRLLMRHGPGLGIDVARLAEVNGLGLHAIRHVFGSRHARKDLLATSLMLHHKSVAITQKYYCAVTEADIDVDALN